MNFRSLALWRRFSGLLGGAIFFLVLTSLVDGMVSGGLKDPFLHELLPGQSVKLSKPMPYGAERLADLELRASNPKISLRFEEIFTGFWMGGALWRAEAKLAQDIPLGEYTVATFHQNGTAANPPQAFTLRVYPDNQAILAASGSFITRYLGIAPYLLAICLLPLALAPMTACFLLTRKISRTLADEGMAEVFRAMASPEGQRIFFPLTPGPAPEENAVIQVLDERGQKQLGTALVFGMTRGDVEAIMQDGVKVRPGVLARR